MVSRARTLSDRVAKAYAAGKLNTDGTITGAAVTTYSTYASVSNTGNSVGDIAIVNSTKSMYVWDSDGWRTITTYNFTPIIDDSSYNSSYTLDSGGNPTILSLTATDSDGAIQNISWSYTASDSASTFVTISQDSSVFTITTKNDSDIQAIYPDGGDFTITFTATDSVSSDTATVTFTRTYYPTLEIYMWGGGASAGYQNYTSPYTGKAGNGGGGGAVYGEINPGSYIGSTFKIENNRGAGPTDTGIAGNNGYGGGCSALWTQNSNSDLNYLALVAGGGGGGGGNKSGGGDYSSGRAGGPGGGNSGTTGNGSYPGGGGTQSAGGASGGSGGSAGSQFQGGSGYYPSINFGENSGGGGGGYYGGGGGGSDGGNNTGGGGGGSSYINTSIVSNGVTYSGSGAYPGNSSSSYRGGAGNGVVSGVQGRSNSRVVIRYQGSQIATGGTITTSGGYTQHVFTGNDTFTLTG